MKCLQLGTARGTQRLKPSQTWRRRSPTRQRPELRDGRGSSWPCILPSFPVERREDRSSFRRTKVRWCEAPEERRDGGLRKYFSTESFECTGWRHGMGIEILFIALHAWMRLNFIFSLWQYSCVLADLWHWGPGLILADSNHFNSLICSIIKFFKFVLIDISSFNVLSL